jgi:DNA-binding MarR family transcriptional regulator
LNRYPQTEKAITTCLLNFQHNYYRTEGNNTMEEELGKYMRVMGSFAKIYTKRIATENSHIKSDLRVSQMEALYAFNTAKCLSMKELAGNAGVKLSNMTLMIDNLIEDGMAVRDKDDKDRRKVMVRLTPEGEKIRTAFLAHRQKVAKTIFVHLAEQDKIKLLTSLDTACKILQNIP